MTNQVNLRHFFFQIGLLQIGQKTTNKSFHTLGVLTPYSTEAMDNLSKIQQKVWKLKTFQNFVPFDVDSVQFLFEKLQLSHF